MANLIDKVLLNLGLDLPEKGCFPVYEITLFKSVDKDYLQFSLSLIELNGNVLLTSNNFQSTKMVFC